MKIGQIVRYGDGPTALFKIKSIVNTRLYGEHCLGGTEGRCPSQCTLASAEDLKEWEKHHKYRKPTIRVGSKVNVIATKDHRGRLRMECKDLGPMNVIGFDKSGYAICQRENIRTPRHIHLASLVLVGKE